jgi:hypothetical protein
LPLGPRRFNDEDGDDWKASAIDLEKLNTGPIGSNLNVKIIDWTSAIDLEKPDDDWKEEESRKASDDVNGSVNMRRKEASRLSDSDSSKVELKRDDTAKSFDSEK